MTKVDDRNDVQKTSHKLAVVARDSFMSGWGGAKGGSSRVAWALAPDLDVDKMLAWVMRRKEMKNATVVNLDTYRAPRNTAHFHIYVTNSSHPAFSS